MDNSVEMAVEKIIAALRAEGKNEISGAKLGAFIRDKVPELNIREVANVRKGQGALSKFINTYLSSSLIRDRQSGVDWIYKIIPSGERQVIPPIPPYWKVFVSTNSSNELALDKDNSSLVIKLRDEAGQDACSKTIKSITETELKAIQQDFVKTIRNSHLVGLLEQTPSYHEWINTLKISISGDYQRWTPFRREALRKAFLGRIEALGVEAEQREKLSVDLMNSQEAQHKQVMGASSHAKAPMIEGDSQANLEGTAEQKFRSALLRVLSNMSVEELRQLKLPYGYVFDVLLHDK